MNEIINNVNTIRENIINTKCRSAWERGVREYALELVDELDNNISAGYVDADVVASPRMLERELLSGASGWQEYSWGGCALIYNGDIAERLCTASELKRTNYGERRPNAGEDWLDTQARALYQAARMILRFARNAEVCTEFC